MDVNEELKFLGKFTKKSVGGGGGVGSGGGQVGGFGLGVQGGCKQRIEFFVKIPKKIAGGVGGGRVGGGVRLDLNEELKFL